MVAEVHGALQVALQDWLDIVIVGFVNGAVVVGLESLLTESVGAVFSTISASMMHGIELLVEEWLLSIVPRRTDMVKIVLVLHEGSLHVCVEKLVLERAALVVALVHLQVPVRIIGTKEDLRVPIRTYWYDKNPCVPMGASVYLWVSIGTSGHLQAP